MRFVQESRWYAASQGLGCQAALTHVGLRLTWAVVVAYADACAAAELTALQARQVSAAVQLLESQTGAWKEGLEHSDSKQTIASSSSSSSSSRSSRTWTRLQPGLLTQHWMLQKQMHERRPPQQRCQMPHLHAACK